ncbi:WcaF family extracellular polysaccharide biosynthesis acetyltransferase [Rhodopirellula sp. SWK7]|uniref:WcaF family extracellular polysaccharide biosynthesis acetyltransferase n=1 Tax=Rhodopirellula sp. SWK7 TaxID=595460 RepID=UPI0006944FE7|nr:WcaF family extracellular polysaccharide biosynthesis acetyltransferase [Rhodopirellula sp. SWK7]
MNQRLDIQSNRTATKYSLRHNTIRIFWAIGAFLFRWTPRPLFGVRRVLLRCFGAEVGSRVHIYPSAVIYFPWNLTIGDDAAIGESALIYNLGPINIGHRATISQRSHLCGGSHDYNDPAMPLLKLPIEIGNDAWVCADAFVGPGVTIGQGSVIGARTVVTKDVPPWTIVAGNPAKQIGTRTLRIQDGEQ